MPLSPEQFWAEYFAPAFEAAHAREAQLSEEAFMDTTLTVCGLELRGMTPYDMLLLSAAENPFITGGTIKEAHIAQFLSILVQPSPRSWLARRRFFKHCRARVAADYSGCVAEILAYVDRMFLHSGISTSAAPAASGDTPPAPAAPRVNLCVITHLVAELCLAMGGWSEETVLHMRLDKLFQYRLALRMKSDPHQHLPAADKLISRALEAYGRYLSTGELPAGPSAAPESLTPSIP